MDKRNIILYFCLAVLFLVDCCAAGPLHHRLIRNAENTPSIVDDSQHPSQLSDNSLTHLPNDIEPDQSDGSFHNNEQTVDESQGLIGNGIDGNINQLNGVSHNNNDVFPDQPQGPNGDGSVGNAAHSEGPSLDADQQLDINHPGIDDVDNANENQESENNPVEIVNGEGLGNGDGNIGVHANGLSDNSDRDGNIVDHENGEYSDVNGHLNTSSIVDGSHNETTHRVRESNQENGNTEYINVSQSNDTFLSQQNVPHVPSTTVLVRSQGRRHLPENELERAGRGNEHLLLDASLIGGTTVETRLSGTLIEHHSPFLLDTGEGINNRSQENALEHETPVGALTGANNQGESKEHQNPDLDNNAEGNEGQEQQNNHPEGNNGHTIAGIRSVTLSHEGIIPDEKHPNEHNEPEIVIVNTNQSTTTESQSEIEHIDNEGGGEPENHQGPEAGVDIPIDQERYNHSSVNKGVEPGAPVHTLNPFQGNISVVVPVTGTTTEMLPGGGGLSTTTEIDILPTPPIAHEYSVGYERGTTVLTSAIDGDHSRENSGSDSDIEGSGSNHETPNTEVECPGGGDEQIVNVEGHHETDGSGSESESVGNDGSLSNENKENKERDKLNNCITSKDSGRTVIQSMSVTLSPSSQQTGTFEQTLMGSISTFGTQVLSDSVTKQMSEYVMHTQYPTMSPELFSVSDYEQRPASSAVTDLYPSLDDSHYTTSLSTSHISPSSSLLITDTHVESIEPFGNSPQSSISSPSPSIATSTLLPTPTLTYVSEFRSTEQSLTNLVPLYRQTSEYRHSGQPSLSTAKMFVESSLISSSKSVSISPESGGMWIQISPSRSISIPPSSSSRAGSESATSVSTTGVDQLTTSSLYHTSTTTATLYTTKALSSNSSTTAPPTPRGTSTSETRTPALNIPNSTKMKLPDSTTNPPLPTTKKRVTIKDKPETYSTTTIPPSTSGRPMSDHSPSSVGYVTLPDVVHVYKTTKAFDLTTPPQVFLQIWIRMSSCQFYFQKPVFITELQQMIVNEKQVTIENEQFVVKIQDLPDEYCKDVPNEIIAGAETLDQITVEMYIKDKKGNTDIVLTYAVSSVIKKGFQNASSAFKDKIVRVDVQNVQDVLRTRPSLENSARTTEEHASVAMVIVLGTVGGCCCVILVILQVILIHRRVTTKRKASYIARRVSICTVDNVALGVIPKSRPNSGYWNPALNELDELCVSKHSHLLNFSELANFCMNDTSIYDEFQAIPCEKPDSSVVPIGEDDKNRFVNVLPHKHTRVKLRRRPGDVSDYINANYVSGYKGNQKAYVATQSPLVNTIEDFWRMVWEQQSRVILMLNPVMASRKPKQSTCYWPDDMKTDVRRLYGDFSVTLKKRDVQQDYIECTLELMDLEGNLKREIRHFWLTCWPESNSLEPLKFVKFILDSRPHYESSGAPAIVHCGPGQGRTGALIAVDVCMRRFEDKRRVDILDCVFKMRNERAGAVQNKEQYALIYQALNEYAVLLSSPSLSTRSSIVTLHAML